MSSSSPGSTAAAGPLANELRDLRRRGIDDLDLVNPPNQSRLDVPQLETLARKYAADDQGSRIPLIRRLLYDGLTGFAKDGHEQDASLIRRLFFAPDGRTPGSVSPSALLDAARIDLGLGEDRFSRRRRATFLEFAEYLIKFVERQTTVTSSDPADPPAASSGRSRAAIGLALLVGLVAIGIVAALLITRHSNSPIAQPRRPTTGSGSPSSTPSGTTSSPMLTFDALGGGSQIIDVYPGVRATVRDRTKNGTYTSGDVVRAICVTKGRTVSSDPSAGEQARKSDLWVRIASLPGVTLYATLTYAEVVPPASELPTCTGVS
jgi:hypothetical protein